MNAREVAQMNHLNLRSEAEALREDIVADRRWLHEHPELGFDLPETTANVAKRLRDMGYEPEEIVPSG